jgi:methyltransferase (TIGR00027 family)
MADLLGGVAVFEVDQPAMSARKQARVRAVFGERPPTHVRYVAVDLEGDDLSSAMVRGGHRATQRSVVVLSGVTPYLESDTVGRVLRWIAEQGAGTCVVFDYCWHEVIEGRAREAGANMVRGAAAGQGEPWRFGIRRGEATSYPRSNTRVGGMSA